ncbi:uncharacterized protein LOC135834039 [Planococcus citri]|uniref:uncharacterized protein LOC135834039 n=1 Tax=Planococcus citri TaxID=170843 RepID=UPI0031F87CF9
MADTLSAVYDLAYPSPVTLKEITSIVVVVELWRREINTYLESNYSDKYYLTGQIRLKNLIPDMPSTIYNQLSNYIVTFRKSIKKWLRYHCFISSDNNKERCFNYILRRFHDFAWDWNGAINYVRTAKRMLQCDRFSLDEKFTIACFYYFEDDIKRIWPSVSTKTCVKEISVHKQRQLFYWSNELHMPLNSPCPYCGLTIDRDEMFNFDSLDNQSSVEYFWNRLPSEGRSGTAIVMYETRVELFARFILPQLSEYQLEEFLAERASGLIFRLLMCDLGRCSVLPAWIYIRNKISGDQFLKLIMHPLLVEVKDDFVEESLELCCEIWYSAPQHMKQLVIDELLKEPPFLRLNLQIERTKPRQMKFLIAVLHDATFEERSAFWYKHWRALIRVPVIEDLLEMTKLCFRNEHEIRAFKNDIMCKYDNIDYYRITSSLKKGRIDKLNKYLDFCCPDEQIRRRLKQRLLHANINSMVSIRFYHEFKQLNEFINDAFERNDVRVEFKTHFITSFMTERLLFKFIRQGDFALLMGFVETFVSGQPAIVPLKNLLLVYFKERLMEGAFRSIQLSNIDNLRRFLIWLLGNEDQVTMFFVTLCSRS